MCGEQDGEDADELITPQEVLKRTLRRGERFSYRIHGQLPRSQNLRDRQDARVPGRGNSERLDMFSGGPPAAFHVVACRPSEKTES